MSNELSKMQRDGLIKVARNRFVLLDMEDVGFECYTVKLECLPCTFRVLFKNLNPAIPCSARDCGVIVIIPTRQMEVHPKQSRLDDVISFGFI